MILISHRGNLFGPQPNDENHPDYIQTALHAGFDVEIDVWFREGHWFLGHDVPEHEITPDFFIDYRDQLWVHCKELSAMQEITKRTYWKLNYFYHTTEDYVLTSHNFIWAYPGKSPGTGIKTICVLPEYYFTPVDGFEGICSDYIGGYQGD